jgi:hypothetical protein
MRPLTTLIGITVAETLLVGPVAAQPGESSGKSFLWKQCDEDVLQLDLNPVPFQEHVGSDFSVRLSSGKARVIIVVQDCPTYWFDGQEIGPTHEVHEWVSIVAPRDLRPIPGAIRTLPTSTWFALFTGSSSGRIRNFWNASGAYSAPIEGISLRAPALEQRGRLSVGPGLSYSWQAQSALPSARLVGVNHDVYARDGAGNIVLNRIQALLNVSSWGSPGTLEVVGGTNPTKLIPSGTYPVSVHTFRPLWAQASLGEAPPKPRR